jgi:hypothetical protein
MWVTAIYVFNVYEFFRIFKNQFLRITAENSQHLWKKNGAFSKEALNSHLEVLHAYNFGAIGKLIDQVKNLRINVAGLSFRLSSKDNYNIFEKKTKKNYFYLCCGSSMSVSNCIIWRSSKYAWNNLNYFFNWKFSLWNTTIISKVTLMFSQRKTRRNYTQHKKAIYRLLQAYIKNMKFFSDDQDINEKVKKINNFFESSWNSQKIILPRVKNVWRNIFKAFEGLRSF